MSWTSEYEQAIIDAGITEPPWGEYGGKPFRFMGGYNPYPKVLEELTNNPGIQEKDLKCDRYAFIRKYGFAIPNEAAMKTLAKYAPIIEVGAGAGYWAWEFSEYVGKNMLIATDIAPLNGEPHRRYGFHSPWHPVQRMNGIKAVRTYSDRTLLIIWPSYDEPWATRVLRAYQGNTFIYVGEYQAACADDAFFELLENDWEEIESVEIPQWYGIHDALWVYKRKQ